MPKTRNISWSRVKAHETSTAGQSHRDPWSTRDSGPSSSTKPPNLCRKHAWMFDVTCSNCKLRGSEKGIASSAKPKDSLRISVIRKQAQVASAAAGPTLPSFLLVTHSDGEGPSALEPQLPFRRNSDQEGYSSSNLVPSMKAGIASKTLRPIDYAADNVNECRLEPPVSSSMISAGIKRIFRTIGGLKKALNCPYHGIEYDDACAHCQLRKTINTPTLFRKVVPRSSIAATLPETSEQAQSLPIEARLNQSTDNEESVGQQLITTSSASKWKVKQRSVSIETVRGKENLPVTFGPLIRDL